MIFKILALAAVLLLCGCNSVTEPSDLAYVVAIGVDEAQKSGSYNITLQVANPIAISGGSNEEGGEGGEKTISEITVEAPTIYSAVNVANHINSKKMTLSHTALFAICDEIAKKDVAEFAETLGRSEELRPNTHITIVRGSAKEYLSQIKPTNEVNPVQYYHMIYGADYAEYIPKVTSQEFYTAIIAQDRGIALPISAIRTDEMPGSQTVTEGFEFLTEKYIAGRVNAESEEKTQTYGMAILEKGKMIAEADAVEAELLNLLRGFYRNSEVSYKNNDDPEKLVTVVQSQARGPKIKVLTDGDVPKIRIELFIEADLRTVSKDYLVEADLDNFEQMATDEIKRAVDRFLYKTSREYGCDIVGFGAWAKRGFGSYAEFEEYNWNEKYAAAEFETDVSFHIRRSGMTDRKKG